MDIILDTNILFSDIKLRNSNIDILLDYLEKTNSRLLYPSVVLDEAKEKYKNKLIENINAERKATTDLTKILFSENLDVEFNIDVENEANKYIYSVHKKFKTNSENILHYKDEYLKTLIDRAIRRIEPLGSDGQQFRDGVIWLTILDYCSTLESKEVIFITNDKSAFSNSKTNEPLKLNANLEKEAERRDLKVNFYRSLKHFIENQHSKIEFITTEWLNENIELENILVSFNESIKDYDYEYLIDHLYLDENERLVDILNDTGYFEGDIGKFYIYVNKDGNFIVTMYINFEKEYEANIETTTENYYDFEYHVPIFNEATGEMGYVNENEFELREDLETETKAKIIYFELVYQVTIENMNVNEVKQISWSPS